MLLVCCPLIPLTSASGEKVCEKYSESSVAGVQDILCGILNIVLWNVYSFMSVKMKLDLCI